MHHNNHVCTQQKCRRIAAEESCTVLCEALPLAGDDNITCQSSLHRPGGIDGIEPTGDFDAHDLANWMRAARLVAYRRKEYI